MFRTEVVKSKNLRKSKAYKVFNAVAIFILLFIALLSSNLLGDNSMIVQWINEHYHNLVSPAILVFAGIIVAFSLVSSSMIRTPDRLGSIEIDENGIRFLVEDEIKETIQTEQIQSIVFEFFSSRNRSNPAGCMNYLNLKTREGIKTFEIVIGNELNKSDLGEMLMEINKKIPVSVKYGYFLKKLFKDKDFKTLRTI